MASVTFDDKSLMIDGNRLWLVSGEMHYFRIPSELWRDRLLKARRAGLNCISTYVAWNFHEPVEGHWEMTGDKDVAKFVELAGELGLYVILRPGPYICAEWDFGGLPGWLTTKSGISHRSANAAFTHYYDKYFRQVLPKLAELQATHSGKIILIQNENEYLPTGMPDRLNYLGFISQLFRRSGFDIPIITCNHLSQPPAPDSIECVNAHDQAGSQFKRLAAIGQKAPRLVTDFYTGWFDAWGNKDHSRRPAGQTARLAMEILGAGAQYNYYMWHGGTNFGFWGARLNESGYQTTSYDFDAPVAEGGTLTEKYYLTRLVNVLADTMGKYFASCGPVGPMAEPCGGVRVNTLAGSLGRWAIVTRGEKSDVQAMDVSLPNGRVVNVSLHPFGAAAIPVGLQLLPGRTIDYSNLTPLGFFGGRMLVFHGPAGWGAKVSVNGRELAAVVPQGEMPAICEHETLRIVFVSSETAMRTWFVDGHLLIGPDFVGERQDDAVFCDDRKQYAALPLEGPLVHRKIKTGPAARQANPAIGSWKRLAVCPELFDDKLEWIRIDKPKDVDRLGAHYGYVWYRLETNEPAAVKRNLFLPEFEDRAMLYLNGKRLDLWGRGAGAVRQPIAAAFAKGKNTLMIFADNLGRPTVGPKFGETKGLAGPVYHARPMTIRMSKPVATSAVPRKLVPRHLTHLADMLESSPAFSIKAEFTLGKVAPVHLAFKDIKHSICVFCNDRQAGFFSDHWQKAAWGDVTLSTELKKGKNVLTFILWGQPDENALAGMAAHEMTEPLAGTWHYRKWTTPTAVGRQVGKDAPVWYSATFKYSPRRDPLFVRPLGCLKGQLYLNGHNLGRFWNVGPQQLYYLPECWLKEENELLIFDELGRLPVGTRLEFCPNGPYSPK
ncbi:MAG: beta-galactosidase [Planctomycetes bacterium]|nr:beta-galactosidase [Planctomycetota bacterium]